MEFGFIKRGSMELANDQYVCGCVVAGRTLPRPSDRTSSRGRCRSRWSAAVLEEDSGLEATRWAARDDDLTRTQTPHLDRRPDQRRQAPRTTLSTSRQTDTAIYPTGRPRDIKVKGFPYSIPSVGPGADPGVQAVSLQVTVKSSTRR